MTAYPSEAFRMYDVLNCAAVAIDEAASGRSAAAEAEWAEAREAATGLFPPGSAPGAAAITIIEACDPGTTPGDLAGLHRRAALLTALDAIANVAFAATGSRPASEAEAGFAEAAVLLVEKPLRDALTVILAEARAMSGVTA